MALTTTSCLYECKVMHERLLPKRHRFTNRFFMFYLDLDELPALDQSLKWFSLHQLNWYRFQESDYFPGSEQPLKRKVLGFLRANGVQADVQRVLLLTNIRMLGYIFNPVSFYLALNAEKQPVACVAMVGNTFGEFKPFLLSLKANPAQGAQANEADEADDTHEARKAFPQFQTTETKHFYVSPFSDLTLKFEFRLSEPANALRVEIDVWNEAETEKKLLSVLTGVKKPLTDASLLQMTCRYPGVTLQVIALIHWHAFLLWLKGVPFFTKERNPHLQMQVLKPHRSLSGFYSTLQGKKGKYES